MKSSMRTWKTFSIFFIHWIQASSDRRSSTHVALRLSYQIIRHGQKVVAYMLHLERGLVRHHRNSSSDDALELLLVASSPSVPPEGKSLFAR